MRPVLRAVLDTNLIVSYLLTQGETLFQIITHWEKGNFIYLVSPAMVTELEAVLARPRLRQQMVADPEVLLAVIEQDAVHTSGNLNLTGMCRDPKDDIFITCAVEGQADVIVSGDADLRDLGRYQGIPIISPRQFLNLLEETTNR